jgi:energy-converting hydrogenase Eha subunit B
MLSTAAEADPMAVAEFKAELRELKLPREVLDVLNSMVDEILASPERYQEIRMKYMAQDVPEDLLPPQFDAEFFGALNIAVDEMIATAGPEMAMGPQAFSEGGLATLRPITEAIRQQGRYGDTMLAHISPREASILKELGGSGTINPYTGLPEFFLKKLFKGVGKALKKVGQAVKKFANTTVGKIVIGATLFFVAGPAALALFGSTAAPALLAATQGFVAAAGTSLIGGRNLKDSLKAGAIGALTAGAFTGITQGASAFRSTAPTTGAPVVESVGITPDQAALPDLGTAARETAAQAYPGTVDTAAGTTAQSFPATVDTASPIPQATGIETVMPGDPFAATQTSMPSPVAAAPADGFRFYEAGRGVAAPAPATAAQKLGSMVGATEAQFVPAEAQRSLLDRILPSRIEAANTMSPRDALAQISRETERSVQALEAVPTNTVEGQMIADRLAQLTKGPGLLTKYGPLAAVGLGTLAATGGFKAEEPQVPPGFEDMAMGISPGQQLLEERPDLYGLRFGGVNTVSSTSPFQYYRPQPVMGAAKGGEAARSKFPRKNGHISGPGTGTSDDIPAMLSDGEFVFTAKAVRNMGDGSRRKGAKRMYALMKKLEGRV